jgi:hypothetical protein
LKTNYLGLSHSLHAVVGECQNVLGSFLGQSVSDLVDHLLVGDGAQDFGQSSHSDFGLFTVVQEQWHQNALDLSWHLSAQAAECVDGSDSDEAFFL